MTPRLIYDAAPARGWLPWGLLTPLLGFLFVAVPAIGVAALLGHSQLIDARGQPLGLPGVLLQLVLAFPLIALLVWAWVHQVERRPLATVGLVGPRAARRFLLGHAIGMGSVLLLVLVITVAGGYRAGEAFPAFTSPGSLAGIALLLLGFALQSSVEEFVFRGWMLSAIARRLNLPLAVGLSSIVFASLHYHPGQPPLALVGTFVISLFLSAWALRAGHIWGVMGWHAGWNWLLATGFELPLSGVMPVTPALLLRLLPQDSVLLTGGVQGPEASIVGVLVFGALSAWLFGRRRSGVPEVVGARS